MYSKPRYLQRSKRFSPESISSSSTEWPSARGRRRTRRSSLLMDQTSIRGLSLQETPVSHSRSSLDLMNEFCMELQPPLLIVRHRTRLPIRYSLQTPSCLMHMLPPSAVWRSLLFHDHRQHKLRAFSWPVVAQMSVSMSIAYRQFHRMRTRRWLLCRL